MFAATAEVASTQYRYRDKSEKLTTPEGRTRGIRDRVNKDFVLGGLLPVHEEDPNFSGAQCGVARRDQWVEAMLFAIDSVNANETLLPNITLGFDIRDTCLSDNVGQDEAFDMIISGSRFDIAGCESTNIRSQNASIPTIGIVGAAASRVSIPIANLGRLFQISQVSFASTSPHLSNKERYSYFYRTVPPDNLQAQALIDVVLHFKWTEISVIYAGDIYGQPMALEVQSLAKANNICIDVYDEIQSSFVRQDYLELAETLLDSNTNIVILIAYDHIATLLLQAVANLSSSHKFTWIASDGWVNRLALGQVSNEVIAGHYGIAQHAQPVPSFDDYFSQLTIQTNTRNHWFDEIYSAFTLCSSISGCSNHTNLTSLSSYVQDDFVSTLIDAVYAFANALHNYIEENCNFTSGWNWANQSCPGQKRELNHLSLLDYLGKVDFISPLTEDRVKFDSLGNAAGTYEILNYQAQISNGVIRYGYKQVGMWSDTASEALMFFDNVTLQFGINHSGGIVSEPPITQCGRCSLGEYHRSGHSCCGVCDRCLGRDYSDDPTAPNCKTCSLLMWGNSPTNGSSYCVPIAETFLTFNHPWSIVLMILAILGLLGVATATVIFAAYWNTPVIKSAGREQMVLLLIGITLSFILPFVYISPPVFGVCIIQGIGAWLALSLMFGSLLIKIVRVARVFFNKTTLVHLRFSKPYHHVLFTFLLVLGQMVIVAAAIAYQVPSVQRQVRLNSENINRLPEVVVTCAHNTLPFAILSISYESAILVASTILGVLSFKYPANFNEAKYVSFCSFAICVIWVAFIVTYLASQSKKEFQSAIIALGMIMTAFTVLVTIFGRKVFIVLFRPKKNVVTLTTQQHHSSVGEDHTTRALRMNNLDSNNTDDKGNQNDKENKKGMNLVILLESSISYTIGTITLCIYGKPVVLLARPQNMVRHMQPLAIVTTLF